MSITSRKKRPLNRNIPSFRDTTLIVIASEGEKTEKLYFESQIFQSRRIQVKVLETVSGHSSPNHVLKRLKAFAKEVDLQPTDQFCLMVDRDRWPESLLSHVCSQAVKGRKQRVNLSISNPSFELWLYLHHDEWNNGEVSSRDIENALREKIGNYNKSNLDIAFFEGKVEIAAQRAITMDQSPNTRWPNNPGTHVYRVIKEIQ